MVVNNKIIGSRIKQRREALNITQEGLGEMVGVTYQQIQKYENGKNKVSAERLAVIAKKLNIPVTFFFENSEEFVVSDSPGSERYEIVPSSDQEQELIKNFRSLPDKDAQSNLVVFLKSVSKK